MEKLKWAKNFAIAFTAGQPWSEFTKYHKILMVQNKSKSNGTRPKM